MSVFAYLSSFIKPAYLLPGFVVPIVPFGIWKYSSDNVHSRMVRDGFRRKLLSDTLGVPAQDIKAEDQQPFGFGRNVGDCFYRLFNLNPDTQSITFDSKTDEDRSEEEHFLSEVSILPPKGRSPSACTVIDLQTRNSDFIYRSELAMKHEEGGWVLWTAVKNNVAGSHGLRYYLIMLSKPKGGSFYDIIGGFSWQDHRITGEKLDPSKLFVAFPGQGAKSFSEGSTGSWTRRSYAGLWQPKSSDPSATEDPLSGLDLFLSEDNQRKSDGVFGKSSSKPRFSREEHSSDVLEDKYLADMYYIKKDNKWFWTKVADTSNYNRNIENYLNFMNSPFEDYAGRWERIQDFCTAISGKTTFAEDDLEKASDMCYELDTSALR